MSINLEELNKFNTLEMFHRKEMLSYDNLIIKENNLQFLQPTPALRELLILIEVKKDSHISQSALASMVGLAPSMINNYMKELIRNNYIEMRGNSRRTMSYHLTGKGITRKSNLLMSYLIEAIKLYKNAKDELKLRMMDLKKEKMHRIVLYGAGETAEVAFNAADELGLDVIGIVDKDQNKQGTEFAGRIIAHPSQIEKMVPEVVVITSLGFQEEIYESIKNLKDKGIEVVKL
ncbi:MAG: winged helix-turn-helix transcriptional regulator [bacterium]|nr:winged helix-turn-helix transcriptional regulator [bacterium]